MTKRAIGAALVLCAAVVAIAKVYANSVVDLPFDKKLQHSDLVVTGVVVSENVRIFNEKEPSAATVRIEAIVKNGGGQEKRKPKELIRFLVESHLPEATVTSCCKKGERYFFFLRKLELSTGETDVYAPLNGDYGVYSLDEKHLAYPEDGSQN